MNEYIIFDVETPNRANNRMSAIGITMINDGRIADSFFSLVDPETHFDYSQYTAHRYQRKNRAGRTEFRCTLDADRADHEQRYSGCTQCGIRYGRAEKVSARLRHYVEKQCEIHMHGTGRKTAFARHESQSECDV